MGHYPTHPTGGSCLLYYSLTLIKHVKRNGIAPRKWTKINVQNSKVPGKSCKRPLQKTRC